MSLSPEEEALKRTEECRRTRAESLDLRELWLTSIPEEAYELTWLKSLNCTDNKLTDLGILQHMPLLESLSCSNQQIDLDVLQYVPRLKLLECQFSQLTNLEALKYTPSLQSLNCSHNLLTDLSVLQNVPHLRSLSCSNNKIADLSVLQYLPLLRKLDCNAIQVNSLDILKYAPKLESLDCRFNKISNLNELQYVPQLQSLNCRSNQITTLKPVQHLQQLQSLNCGSNQLTDLSPLQHMPQLQSLDCSTNQITNLSPLQHVPQLQSLNCGSNQLADLNFLQHVQKLQSLDCSANQLTDLSPLQYLQQLQSLDCGYNPQTNLTPLRHVQQLQSLSCNYNQLTDLSPLQYLQQLQSLDCSWNQVTDLSQLHEHVMSGQLRSLKLYSNRIKNIPPIIFGYVFDDCLENLRNYWLDLEKGSVKKNQLKVQLVGNGRVGKTTLAYALEHKKGPDENFKSTHGITIRKIPHTLNSAQDPVNLQLWDFGGQEIYHATHRLFLGDDCLYLLLWAEETEEHPDETRHPVSYWLELIHDLAPNSPIILIKNQIDRSDKQSARPSELADDALPGVKQIRQDVKISAQKYKGMGSLRGAIEDVLEELQHRVCLELPTSWIQVEEDLKQIDQETIPFAHFQQLCIKAGVGDAKWFADYLHKTGTVFYREGAFNNHIILNQNWVIEAVYQLFNPQVKRPLIERMQGSFNGADTEVFWPNVSDTEREIYLNFMSSCGICYQPNKQYGIPFAEREFIIPALLPETSPAKTYWNTNEDKDWFLKVSYPFLHRSIIERLIVKIGEDSETSNLWRHGIGSETPYGKVLLECEYEDTNISNKGCLRFKLQGQQLDELLYKIRKLVKEVSPHNRYQEKLTKNGNKEVLPAFEERSEPTDNNGQDQSMSNTVKLFISYSHADEPHKDELEICLKNIKRRCPQLEYWEDRQMFAGEPVDEQILSRLEAADIVVLLISRNFFASDYCFTIEMEKALKRYVEKENIVIPIIVRSTADWHDFDIGKITVLPKDGKPLIDWPDEDKFWENVQIGIRKQVEKLSR